MKIKYILFVLPILMTGCFTTIAPKPINSNTLSFSGTNSNSGILGTRTNGEGEVTSVLINKEDVDRYNYLIRKFYKRFAPPLTHNAGIIKLGENLYEIDAQHFAEFSLMNFYWKNNVKY